MSIYIPGYKIGERIWETSLTSIYRAIQERDNKKLLAVKEKNGVEHDVTPDKIDGVRVTSVLISIGCLKSHLFQFFI